MPRPRLLVPLLLLALAALTASLVAMYFDLRKMRFQLWETRPIVWFVAGALVYIVVFPLYVYNRRSISA